MLSVRIDGREVETTPVSLARLVLDGRVDRHCPSKTPGTTAERSLEQSLESPHCEALSDELLSRLRSMYASESPEIDIQELCEQVERLCQWRWANPHIAARFFWAAAWLNDVMDRLENAAEFYDAFLQASSREDHLRLLAYNNRGVLRIRLGRLEGVLDLARAAVPAPESQTDAPSSGLPAACFNLLNLISVALGSRALARAVDEELAEYFSQAGEDLRTFWLGGEAPGQDGEQPPRADPAEDASPSLLVLRDPTWKRLNLLTSRLAEQARELAGGAPSPTMGRLSTGASQLILWESRSNGEGLPGNGDGADSSPAGYGFCAEAASLLLSEDIPSSLTRLESPLARAEQSAREELANIESRLTLNQYELARSRLEVQRRILSSLNRRGRLAGLLARVDAQLERVAYLQSQSEQLDLQRACAGLIASVEQFCRLTDLCRAQRERDDLIRRCTQIRSGLEPQTGDEVAVLLDELTARLDRHLHRLKRLDIRKGIRHPLRTFRQNWPEDWTVPVPETVYQALAQCQAGDPQGWVEDWAALKERLDGHQGQYHLHKALDVLRAGQASRDSVDGDLVDALVLKPDQWPALAPLFGLFCSSSAGDSQTVGGERSFGRAGDVLERAFARMEGRASRCLELWRCVAATLSPVLEREDLDAIAQVKALAERCLDRWPMGTVSVPGRVDPRNPVNLFLESCDKARRLVEAGQQLNARPPRRDEAAKGYGDLLDLGLDTRDQLLRAATGYYLAACHEQDAPHMQRQILAGLEAWVIGKSETVPQVRKPEVVEEITRLRSAIASGEAAVGSERDALAGGPGSCPNDSKGGGHDPQEEGKSEA